LLTLFGDRYKDSPLHRVTPGIIQCGDFIKRNS
jgi:hypothetical protein